MIYNYIYPKITGQIGAVDIFYENHKAYFQDNSAKR
jgi:hypothetical protein